MMNAALVLFGAFVLLSPFNAGAMTTLQIQHYGIYSSVGRENFAAYMRANNRAALVPVILPALSLLFASACLLVTRPHFMTLGEAALAFGLNLTQLASTFVWQRRLQAEMAETGYDTKKAQLLLRTNWIRTVAFLVQSCLVAEIVMRVLMHVQLVEEPSLKPVLGLF